MPIKNEQIPEQTHEDTVILRDVGEGPSKAHTSCPSLSNHSCGCSISEITSALIGAIVIAIVLLLGQSPVTGCQAHDKPVRAETSNCPLINGTR